jgi:anti-sigma factor RsiW
VSHPEDLLADYVDGTLAERERAVVDTHLDGCARCSAEIRQAEAAKTALSALEDVPVPFGVTGPVLAEAGRRFERRRGVAWERFQWAAGLTAAAALIVVVALNVGGGDAKNAASPAAATGATGGSAAAGGAEAAAPGAIPFQGIERQPDVDYDDAGIHAVAVEVADAVAAAGETAAAEGSPAPQAVFASAAQDAKERTTLAKDCVGESGIQGPQDLLIRLIEAEFEGTAAYIAVFSEGPGAGQPADHIVVFVVARDDCRILSTASQRIPPG